jgi:pilus assembly protein CpaB
VNRRLIGLVVAVLLAAIATIVIVNYVRTADERAREAEELAEVYVAQEDIAAGMSADNAIEQGLIARDEIPSRSVPSGAIAELSQIEGDIATVDIVQGEVIVSQRFGTTVAETGGRFEVPDGLQAVSVQVSVVPGVAGFIEPEDTVSIVGRLSTSDPEDDEEEAGAEDRAQFLIQNALVLAVGQRVVTGEEGPRIRRSDENYIFTLALEPEDVERLVFANAHGALTFTLLPDDEQPEIDTPGRTFDNAFS